MMKEESELTLRKKINELEMNKKEKGEREKSSLKRTRGLWMRRISRSKYSLTHLLKRFLRFIRMRKRTSLLIPTSLHQGKLLLSFSLLAP
jgi:hypothetical protein